jgi:hypothetical protein
MFLLWKTKDTIQIESLPPFLNIMSEERSDEESLWWRGKERAFG